jgi:rubrerythrin
MDDFTLHEALKLAVTTEQIGAKVYTRLAKKFAGEKDIAEVFSKLAKDERAHESQFQALLDQNPNTAETPGRHGVDEYLRATAISEFFRDEACDRFDKIEEPTDALANALAMERAALLFYQAIRDTIGADTALDQVIEAEKNHLTTLMRVILADAKFRGLSDTW